MKTHIQRWAPQDWRTSRVRARSARTGDRDLRLVYLELLFALYEAGGSIPDKPVDLEDEVALPWAVIEPALAILADMGAITRKGGVVRNGRVSRELAEELEFRQEQSRRGRRGNRARWQAQREAAAIDKDGAREATATPDDRGGDTGAMPNHRSGDIPASPAPASAPAVSTAPASANASATDAPASGAKETGKRRRLRAGKNTDSPEAREVIRLRYEILGGDPGVSAPKLADAAKALEAGFSVAQLRRVFEGIRDAPDDDSLRSFCARKNPAFEYSLRPKVTQKILDELTTPAPAAALVKHGAATVTRFPTREEKNQAAVEAFVRDKARPKGAA